MDGSRRGFIGHVFGLVAMVETLVLSRLNPFRTVSVEEARELGIIKNKPTPGGPRSVVQRLRAETKAKHLQTVSDWVQPMNRLPTPDDCDDLGYVLAAFGGATDEHPWIRPMKWDGEYWTDMQHYIVRSVVLWAPMPKLPRERLPYMHFDRDLGIWRRYDEVFPPPKQKHLGADVKFETQEEQP